MIVESTPEEMEKMVKVVVNLINSRNWGYVQIKLTVESSVRLLKTGINGRWRLLRSHRQQKVLKSIKMSQNNVSNKKAATKYLL